MSLPKAKAQSERRLFFAGITPSITVEPFYQKGELDLNIFPIVYQRTISNRFDLRLTTILNLGVRNNGNEISHLGIETAIPFFIKKKESKYECSNGLFASPVVSLTRNRMEQHNNLGFWLEPGYNLLFENKFAISFGLQIGTTYFKYDTGETKWRNHFGVKIVFGRWI